MRTIEQLMTVAQNTQRPELLDYIAWDVAVPAMASIYGTPNSWISTPEAVQAMMKQRQQQAQQQQAIQAAPAAAGIIKATQGQPPPQSGGQPPPATPQ
jgi:hypothetical protein